MALIRNTKDLGAYIRRIRRARGFSQVELAELAGVGVVYVSNLERGKDTAEIGKALHLLQLLSVDLEATDRQSASEAEAPRQIHQARSEEADSSESNGITLARPRLSRSIAP